VASLAHHPASRMATTAAFATVDELMPDLNAPD
jgi:hypothetical protein